MSRKIICLSMLAGVALPAALAQDGDTNCPRYPANERTEAREALDLDGQAAEWREAARKLAPTQRTANIARNNFIDNHIFDALDQGRVAPAALSSDAEFLRRVSIDLTGRIPTAAKASQFLADPSPDKRARLVEEFLASPAFVDQWTLHFANRFEVTSGYYSYIGIEGRNQFHAYLRDFVARDRSYKDVVAEMLTAAGDADLSGPANFIVRAWQDGDPIQDTWDTLSDRVTTKFLGVKTECISCHDGRRHLEQINLHLTGRKRQEFWGLSAFFSRLNYQRINVDGFGQRARFLLVDRKTGRYSSSVAPTNPGPRPLRWGGPYTPVWPWGGQTPNSENWREDLAAILTSDPQFARASVNYTWAALFNYGLVDPPDAWDLARVDPKQPPPKDWPLQVTHPDLLNALADYFVKSNYSVRSLVRLMVNSNAYQLSSRYDGQWRPEYTRYFARHFPRRLSAEELWDTLSVATGTETPMAVYGFDQPVLWANQLPDPTEPRSNSAVVNFMNLFGRGDWWRIGRSSSPALLQLLYTMNDSQVVLRTFAQRSDAPSNVASKLAASPLADQELVREMFLSTLTRFPTDGELRTVLDHKKGPRIEWVADLQWVLLNKLDFMFQY